MLTCDEDAEFIVIEHPISGDTPHVHHKRVAVVKKSAEEIILEPMIKLSKDRTTGHEQKCRYTRTHDKDAEGRTIFRLGPAVV